MALFSHRDQFLLFGNDLAHSFISVALEIATGCARMLLPNFQADPAEVVFTLDTFDMIAS